MFIDFFVMLTPLVLDVLEKIYPSFASDNTWNDKATTAIVVGASASVIFFTRRRHLLEEEQKISPTFIGF